MEIRESRAAALIEEICPFRAGTTEACSLRLSQGRGRKPCREADYEKCPLYLAGFLVRTKTSFGAFPLLLRDK